MLWSLCFTVLLFILLPDSIVKSLLHNTAFLTILKTPTEACLYGCINCCLAHAQQQSSLGLSQSSTCMRDGRTRSRATFQLNVLYSLCQECNWGSVAEKPHSDTVLESHQSGRKTSGCVAFVTVTDSKKKGSCGVTSLMCYCLQLNQHHLHPLCRLLHFHTF